MTEGAGAPADGGSPRRLVKVFGERHTSTTFVERTLAGWPGIKVPQPRHRYGPHATRLANELAAAADLAWSASGKHFVREALQDAWVRRDGPLGAWKHCAPIYNRAFAEAGARVVFTVKSPGAWIVSLFRRPYNRLTDAPEGETLEAFAASPWITTERENVPQVVHSPLALWTLKVSAYLAFRDRAEADGIPSLFLRSEDLILDQKQTLTKLADWLGVAVDVEESAYATKDPEVSLDDLKRYYGNETWREELTPTVVEAIRRTVPPELLDLFGYHI